MIFDDWNKVNGKAELQKQKEYRLVRRQLLYTISEKKKKKEEKS